MRKRTAWVWAIMLLLLQLGERGAFAESGDGRARAAVAPNAVINVLTYHNDNARTGQNPNETILTPAHVNAAHFGKIGFYPTDGQVYAQPLFFSHRRTEGGVDHIVYVATEHDTVYAFDADTAGAVLWKVSLLGKGETPSDDRGCGQITPEIGVTSTPVVDPAAGPHGTIFVVAMSKDHAGHYFQRLHALDAMTGAERPGSPATIQARYPGRGDHNVDGWMIFDPAQYKARSGLLLLNGIIYTCWASHCDYAPYGGWIIAYDEHTLRQSGVLDLTPNGSEGAMWGSGAAPAADSSGHIYLMTGNGTFETDLDASGFPRRQDYGNAFLKLSTAHGGLAVADYFTMKNTVWQSSVDWDLGSGGVLLLPDCADATGRIRHLAVGAGKDQNIYVVDRDDLGKFDPRQDRVYQELVGALEGQEYGMPAYFDGLVYYCSQNDALKAYRVDHARLSATPVSRTERNFVYPGATPSISSHGAADAIVWVMVNPESPVLHAYDAHDLSHELYNSSQASGDRDQIGGGIKFATPTIAGGKVFIGTQRGVAVFGLRTRHVEP